MLSARLSTLRCQLRPAEPGDLPFIEDALSHPRFPKNLHLSAAYRDGRLSQWLQRMCELNSTPGSAMWTVDLNTGIRSIGQVGLFAGKERYSLSFWLSPTYWGQGLTQEAVAKVVAHFRNAVGAKPLWAGAAIWNEPSARVLLAVGFSEGALLEDGYSVDGQSFAVRQFWFTSDAPI